MLFAEGEQTRGFVPPPAPVNSWFTPQQFRSLPDDGCCPHPCLARRRGSRTFSILPPSHRQLGFPRPPRHGAALPLRGRGTVVAVAVAVTPAAAERSVAAGRHLLDPGAAAGLPPEGAASSPDSAFLPPPHGPARPRPSGAGTGRTKEAASRELEQQRSGE